MKKLKILFLLVVFCTFGTCGCNNFDSEAVQKQLEELQKQNEELNNRLDEMDRKTDAEITEAPETTMTLAPINTPEPAELDATLTPEPTHTPTSELTSMPVLTANPKPISTPVPTAIPKPTSTPEPTATPKPTNTPRPTATPKEDFTNREWISVDGGWEFTIDLVEIHEFCNSYSDKNDSAQCIVVTYSYKNTGFYDRDGEDSLYISDMDIDVYDEEGVKAERYPCRHTKNPSEIVTGTKCSKAQAAYALENTSNEITLFVKIYRYDIHKEVKQKFIINIGDDRDFPTATATPKPTNTPKPTASKNDKIKENLDILKKYVIQNGKYDDGHSTVVYNVLNDEGMVATIGYDYVQENFLFTNMLYDEKTINVLQFEWGEAPYENTTVYSMYADDSTSSYFISQAKLSGINYNSEDLEFEVIEDISIGSVALYEEILMELINNQLRLAMIVFDAYMLPMCGLNLSDIGFKAFNLTINDI